jgi:hypothetical protein
MKTVVGLFDTYAHAETAAHDLERAGISHNDISLLANNTTAQFGPTDAASIHTAYHADTETEAGKGAVAGGVAGLLVSLAAFASPGLGAVAAAGWLVTTVAGAVVGAGVGIVGALNGVGVPHEDAAYYNEGVRRGGTLLAVRAPDHQATQVAQILSADGAVNIDERAEQYRQEGFAPPAPPLFATPPVAPPAPVAAAAITHPIPPSLTSPVASAAEPALNSAVTAPEQTGAVYPIDRGGETTLPIADEGLQGVNHEAEHGGVRVYHHTAERPAEPVAIVEEVVLVEEELIEVEQQPSDLPTRRAGLFAPTRDLKPQITCRAYELYEQRGHRNGHALDDWLDAERELQSHEVGGTNAEAILV